MSSTALHAKRGLIVPDVHAPYHNKLSWAVMMKVAKEWKPDVVVVLGDLVDFYSLSQHGGLSPARGKLAKAELESANGLLDNLDGLNAGNRVFISGNHERRFDRFIADHASQLFGLTSVQQELRLAERGWQWIPYNESITIGKVVFTHDLGGSGPNAVRQALLKAQHSIVIGHIHRTDYIVQSDVKGKPRIGLCPGWLGDANEIDYTHALLAKTEWNQGFALFELWDDGIMTFLPVPIVAGTARVLNKTFHV